MSTRPLANSILQRPVRIIYQQTRWQVARAKMRVFKLYADLRVGATAMEKRAHKQSDTVLLTFDDYGSTDQIGRLLDVLRAQGVMAVFFLQGDWAATNPELVKAIATAGHVIGNHTFSHADLIALSDEEVRSEITKGPKSAWLRPPRGKYNSRVRRVAADLGYRICYWSVDSDDWKGVPAEYMTRKIRSELHPGAVILFHAHSQNTIAALPQIIADIRARGFELTGFDEPSWERAA